MQNFAHVVSFVELASKNDKTGGVRVRDRLHDPEVRMRFIAKVLPEHAAKHVLRLPNWAIAANKPGRKKHGSPDRPNQKQPLSFLLRILKSIGPILLLAIRVCASVFVNP